MARKSEKSDLPIAVDLFSGCGGISTGLLDAGIRVVAGFDYESRSIETYNYNHNYRGAQGFVADLSKMSGREILDLAGVKSVDLVAGGPPCQAFSIVGARKGLADRRGQLIFDYVRIVDELRPKAFILENVPNMKTFSEGKVFEMLTGELAALGYKVSASILFAADYGVPQMRKRLFIVGVKGRVAVELPPPPTHGDPSKFDLFNKGLKPYITCSASLSDLPDVSTRAGHAIPNHEETLHSSGMLEALKNLQPGKRDKKSFHDRLHPEKLSYTLRAGNGNFSPLRPVHYKYHRVISVRESARIQSFSDDFIWQDSVPRLQQYRQVGNAVPPLLAKAVGMQVAKTLNWNLDAPALKGRPSTRPSAITMTREEKMEQRLKRIRGASKGTGPVDVEV
jgi:DNA (cytosine-5)-methyltransferase 1